MSISVVILTNNEEVNIVDCLESLAWCDDVVVYDSYSSDNTVKIAAESGARVYQRKFYNYANQRNAALHQIVYKNPWVLMLDADERTPADLVSEIQKKTLSAGDVTLMQMRRKDMFMGKWIRRSSGYPTWFGRLMKPEHVEVKRSVNEEYHTDGKVEQLEGHIIHYPFNRGITHWLSKHNRYSSMEAEIYSKEDNSDLSLRGLFSSNPAERRKTFKAITYSLPMRPLLIFLYLYVYRGGFLDGKPGYYFCKLRYIYESMIDLKKKEIEQKTRNFSI